MAFFVHALLPLWAALALVSGDGWLGIYLADAPRATIGEVVPDSPAARAGLLAGDVIIAVDDEAVATAEALVAKIQSRQAGAAVKLAIERGDRRLTVLVVLAESPHVESVPADPPRPRPPVGREAAPGAESAPQAPWLGLVLAASDAGLRVEEVVLDGPAAKAGILPGDVLGAIGDQPVPGFDALDLGLRALAPGQAVVIRVTRGESELTTTVTVGAAQAAAAAPEVRVERAREEVERLRAEQLRLVERLEQLGRRIDELERRLERAGRDG